MYEASHAPRYERQELIRRYQCTYDCRLVVLSDVVCSESVTLFEETLYDADPSEDLHVVLSTPGGDGETAIRLIRQAQSRCKELTVIVPDQAKSAGTLFVLGADHIRMGPTSDLGPVGTTISGADAAALGLPVTEAEAGDRQWQEVWRLWMKYRALGDAQVYEGHQASFVRQRQPPV